MLSDKLKSKKGISLPLAMAIISVLIILSASLIAIAGTSVMSTSSSVNSRQAYLNVRSALEYAYAYYNNPKNVDPLSKINGPKTTEYPDGEPQYMIMNDDWFMNSSSGGTTKGTVRISQNSADTVNANTFVAAQYIPSKGKGGNALLKLTAYSKSTDAFGNRSESVHMSASYVINSSSNKNRVTMTDIDSDTEVTTYNAARNAITLHCKQLPGQDWTPFFYLWTYDDQDMTFDEIIESDLLYKDNPNRNENNDYLNHYGNYKLEISDKTYSTGYWGGSTSYWENYRENKDTVKRRYEALDSTFGKQKYDDKTKSGTYSRYMGYENSNKMYGSAVTCYDIDSRYKFVTGNYDYEKALLLASIGERRINKNEDKNHSHAPVSIWNVAKKADGSDDSDSLDNGPTSCFTEAGGGWYNATYYINEDYVNYFNLIITKKGQVLSKQISGKPGLKKATDIQSNEMFHLWFLSADDRNIYFEFLKAPKEKLDDGTYKDCELVYYMGSDWNGLDGLDDRFLVYVNNQKTAVHFRVKGMDDNAVELNANRKAPLITQVYIGGVDLYDESNEKFTQGVNYSRYGANAGSNQEIWGSSAPYFWQQISVGDSNKSRLDYLPEKFKSGSAYDYNIFKRMMYEGSGWWVANIPAGVSFTMGIEYYDETGKRAGRNSITVSPNSNRETFVVADKDQGTMYSRLTESVACSLIGVDPNSYTTVRYKASSVGMVSAPRLDYSEGNTSLEEKRKLRELIEVVYRDYAQEDFTKTSYGILKTALDNGIKIYNEGEGWLKDHSSLSLEDKKKHFNDAIDQINNALKSLETAQVGENLIKSFNDVIAEAKKIIKEQEENATYDVNAYAAFHDDKTSGGTVIKSPYNAALEAQANIGSNSLSVSKVKEIIKNLQNSIKTVLLPENNTTAKREALIAKIEEAELASENGSYEQDARQKLQSMLIKGYKRIPADYDSAIAPTFEFAINGANVVFNRDALETLAFSPSTNKALKQAISDLEIVLTDCQTTTSTEGIKDQISRLTRLIYKVKKFIEAENNSTRVLLDALSTEVAAADTVAKTTTVSAEVTVEQAQKKLNDAYDKLKKAYEDSYILKPNAALNVNSATNLEIDAENKFRIWFKGFSLKSTNEQVNSIDTIRVVDKDGNELPNDPLHNYKFVIDGLSADEYRNNLSMGGNITESRMTEIHANDIMYYDYRRGSNDALQLTLSVNACTDLTFDNSIHDYTYNTIRQIMFTTPKAKKHSGNGTVYSFEGIEAVYQGTNANGDRLYKYNLLVSVGTLAELYIDPPEGASNIKAVTVDDKGKEETFTTAIENKVIDTNEDGTSVTKKYYVARVVAGENKKVYISYKTSGSDKTIFSEYVNFKNSSTNAKKDDYYIYPGQYVVTVTPPPETATKKVKVSFDYGFDYQVSRYNYYNPMPALNGNGETREAPALRNAYNVSITEPSTLSLVLLNSDNTVISEITPTVENGTYSAEFDYVAGMKLRINHSFAYQLKDEYPVKYTTRYAWDSNSYRYKTFYKPTELPRDMTSGNLQTNSVSFNEAANFVYTEYYISFNDANSISNSVGNLSNLKASTYVYNGDDILGPLYPLNKTSTSGAANTAANSTLLTNLVSESLLPDMNVGTSALVSDNKKTTYFDYFGQSGMDVVPTVNIGHTVIWLEQDLEIEGSDNKKHTIDWYIKTGNYSAPCIYAYSENLYNNSTGRTDLLGKSDNYATMISVENTNCYYAVVDSSVTHCIIKIKGEKGNSDIYLNKNSDQNGLFYFDDTGTHATQGKDMNGYSLCYKPSQSKISGQGRCEPYAIIKQEAVDGNWMDEQKDKDGKPWKTRLYYSNKTFKGYDFDPNDYPHSRFTYSDYAGYGEPQYFYNCKAQYKYRVRQQIKPPTYTVEVDEAAPLDNTDLRMPFVGGSKLRIVNESYYATYSGQYFCINHTGGWAPMLYYMKNSQNRAHIGSLKKTKDYYYYDSYAFGGCSSTDPAEDPNNSNYHGGNNNFNSGNNYSEGRVGDARLYVMYDWYEYKIPVDKTNTYTFQISGVLFDKDKTNTIPWSGDIECDTGRYTAQIQDVYGDVYVVMNSTVVGVDDNQELQTSSGAKKKVYRYRDITLYTCNPDNVEMESTERIYFDTHGENWTNLKVYAWGISSQEIDFQADSENKNLYYADISSSTPFLTITGQKEGATTSFTAKTTLQGDDKCKFDPKLSAGLGGWVDYVPPKLKLKRALYNIQGLYYSKVIPYNITEDYEVEPQTTRDTYQFPKAIEGKFLTNANFKDGTVIDNPSANVDEVNRWIAAYTNLYNMISKAKSYLGERDDHDNPLPYVDNAGGKHYYREYKYNNTPNIYDDESLDELYKELIKAEKAYLGSSSTITEIESAYDTLRETINGVKLSTKGMLTFIYYDAQGFVKAGKSFGLKYYLSRSDADKGINAQEYKIKYFNTDGLPIAFIKANELYDVCFTIDGNEQKINKSDDNPDGKVTVLDGAWVYMDIATTNDSSTGKSDAAYWVKNSVADYQQFNVSEFEQNINHTQALYEMKPEPTAVGVDAPEAKTLAAAMDTERKYQPSTLYFKNDTEVKYYPLNITFNLKVDKVEQRKWVQYFRVHYWYGSNSFDAYFSTINGDTATVSIPVTKEMMDSGSFNYLIAKVEDPDKWKYSTGDQSISDLTSYKSGEIVLNYHLKSDMNYEHKTYGSTKNLSKAVARTGSDPAYQAVSYKIRAGAYSFDHDHVSVPVKDSSGVYYDSNEDSYKDTPFVYSNPTGGQKDNLDTEVGSWRILCNLFSERARVFFETPQNYLKLVNDDAGYTVKEATDSTIGWITQGSGSSSDELSMTAGTYNSNSNINMTANTGSFLKGRQYFYSTTGDLYFRWEGNKALGVNNNVTMLANKLILCSSGVLDATYISDKHFRIGKINSDSMTVVFGTDITVQYYDIYSELHKFTIREGEYVVKRPPKFNGKSYICDLCDEDYWTSMEYVTIVNRYNQGGGYGSGDNGSGRLSNPVYS